MRQRSVGARRRAGQTSWDDPATAPTGGVPERLAVGPKIDWWLWPTAVAAPIELMVLVVALDLGSPWRPIAALVFLTVSPGASLIPLIGIRDIAMELVLVIPLSFALVALSSVALFYARLWSPNRQLALTVGLCLVGLLLQCTGARHRGQASVRG